MIPSLLSLFIVFSFVDDSAREKAEKRDLEKLQGTWIMAALEVDAKQVPAEKLKSSTLKIEGDKYIIQVGDQKFEAVLKLDPTKKPAEFDMTFLDGENKDKTSPGIYEITGDSFKLCRARLPGKDRPTEFATWPDSGLFVVTWKKK